MEKTIRKQSSDNISKRAIWDCGSSLYDSFELKSFEKQLDSAIASRTMSMPHLSDHRRHHQPPPPPPAANKKPTSRISRSLNRFLRSVFRTKSSTTKNTNPDSDFGGGFYQERSKDEGFYVFYHGKSGDGLSAIPESPEFDGLSPEIRSLVRRTASERLKVPASVGIYCA